MKAFFRKVAACLPGLRGLITPLIGRWRSWLRNGRTVRQIARGLPGAEGALQVLTGPFAGLRYFDRHVWGMISNKWLGSYEAELDTVVTAILDTNYRRIIDVGCAEGWYIVGLAVRMPNTEFVAFDIDPISRGQCHKLARLNACSARVRIAGECTHADMDTLAGAGTLLICDIEGFERMLLDPAQAPALMQTEVLVEVHEDGADSRDLNQLLRARFDATHRIQEIWPEDRQAWVRQNRPAVPATIDDGLLLAGVQEHRAPGNHWLWMTCR